MNVISVSKRRQTGTSRGRKYTYKKRIWFVYYRDDYGRFKRFKINWWEVLYWKLQVGIDTNKDEDLNNSLE